MGTLVEFGGGSTIEQKRNLTKHKYGTQISGYTGTLPQVNLSCGATFGELTHRLACLYEHSHPIIGYRTEQDKVSAVEDGLRFPARQPTEHVYNENMKSGYMGYIPRSHFIGLSRGFPTATNLCLNDHLNRMQRQEKTDEARRHTVKAFPRLQELNFDPHVQNFLDCYESPGKSKLAAKRMGTEAPISSYAGFIPRRGSTEAGLGVGHHGASTAALSRFKHETCHHYEIIRRPVSIKSSDSSVPRRENDEWTRTYQQDGMISKYHGHVPELMSHFGGTFGHLTRKCDCCSHGFPNFGSYQQYQTNHGLKPVYIVT